MGRNWVAVAITDKFGRMVSQRDIQDDWYVVSGGSAWVLGTVVVLVMMVLVGYGWLCWLEVRLHIQQRRLAMHLCRDPGPINPTLAIRLDTKGDQVDGVTEADENRSISVDELLTREHARDRARRPPDHGRS